MRLHSWKLRMLPFRAVMAGFLKDAQELGSYM